MDRATPYHVPHSTQVAGYAVIYGGDDRYVGNLFLGGDVDRAYAPESRLRDRAGHGTAGCTTATRRHSPSTSPASTTQPAGDHRTLPGGQAARLPPRQRLRRRRHALRGRAGPTPARRRRSPSASSTKATPSTCRPSCRRTSTAARVGVVTGLDLDRVRFVDADFEERDGTPAVIDTDLVGERKEHGQKLPGRPDRCPQRPEPVAHARVVRRQHVDAEVSDAVATWLPQLAGHAFTSRRASIPDQIRPGKVRGLCLTTHRPARTSSASACGPWAGRPATCSARRPGRCSPAVEAVHKLAELGAYGITFHDDDLVPPGSSSTERAPDHRRVQGTRWPRPGMVVPMVTTNLFGDPVFKDGGFTSNDRSRAPVRAAQGDAQHGPRRRAGRADLRVLGRPGRVGGRLRQGRPRGAGPLPRGHRPARAVLASTRATACGSRSSRSRTSPAATSCCPRSGTRWRSSTSSSTPTWSASTPRPGTSRWPASTTPTASRRRCGRASCSTSTSTARRARATTRTWSSATATCCRRSPPSTCWRTAPRAAGPTYDGDRHFDYKPLRTENMDGVWESALANMELYLALRDRSQAFRADPEVQEALEAAGVAELADPTLDEGETYEQLLADRSAFEDYDIDAGPHQGLRLRPDPAARPRAPPRRPVSRRALTTGPRSAGLLASDQWSRAACAS